MESATAIFYGEDSIKGEGGIDRLVAHEIAHQWWGNAVTEGDWDDVWLSEGFATYFTLLFVEHAYGAEPFREGLRQSLKTILTFEEKNPGYRVVHDTLSDMRKVITSHTYQKGGWTLHMLRGIVGTDRFWAGIREYYRLYRDGSASTADFRRVMEEASGRDLGWFFDQWLYRGGIPRIRGGWRYDPASGEVAIELTQTQAGAPFRLPLEVAIKHPGETTPARLERLELTEARQTFRIAVPGKPGSIVLDPGLWVLMESDFEAR
jgi:aminopeptidase N